MFSRYSLENNFDGKFSVHPNTGELFAVKSLDREETAIYNLKLVARDSGLIPKMVTADVTVIVDDKNDDTPQFERDSYQQTVNNPTQQGKQEAWFPKQPQTVWFTVSFCHGHQ